MDIPEVKYPEEKALDLSRFKEMDYYTVNNFALPIELMMENAGLQLANLIAKNASTEHVIKVGVGPGNNGGGGLVAARRLSAWGYKVYLDLPFKKYNGLVKKQLDRALKFGVKIASNVDADIWVDAYLGFSQRLPLPSFLTEQLTKINKSEALKITLDIPTGFLGNAQHTYFQADKIVTLAAPKKILYHLPANTQIYVADLGIPSFIYEKFGVPDLPFNESNILKIIR